MFSFDILPLTFDSNVFQSAFSIRFAKFGLNHYVIFAPDLMHEFELGIWKAIFIHILRLLVALGGDSIQEFDSRQV